MSNDGRSIGEHLRDTESAVVPDDSDSSADSSATRQPGRDWERETNVTNRAPSEEQKRQQRKPPRGDRKGGAHA
jgi:hypothetical protein